MLMNFIVIVVTWSAPQCALEAREEEKEGALQRTPAPARGPDHGAQSCVCSLEWGGGRCLDHVLVQVLQIWRINFNCIVFVALSCTDQSSS